VIRPFGMLSPAAMRPLSAAEFYSSVYHNFAGSDRGDKI